MTRGLSAVIEELRALSLTGRMVLRLVEAAEDLDRVIESVRTPDAKAVVRTAVEDLDGIVDRYPDVGHRAVEATLLSVNARLIALL